LGDKNADLATVVIANG